MGASIHRVTLITKIIENETAVSADNWLSTKYTNLNELRNAVIKSNNFSALSFDLHVPTHNHNLEIIFPVI